MSAPGKPPRSTSSAGRPKNQLTLHIPLNAEIEGDERVVLYVGSHRLSPKTLESLYNHYGRRVHRMVFDCLPDDTSVFETESPIIFVVPTSLGELLAKKPPLHKWRRARILFQLPAEESAIRLANHLTAQGFPVRIPIADLAGAPEIARKCLDFYLHNRSLTVPIDPFHSLFAAACARRTVTFWKIESEEIARDIYISNEGHIGPSAATWARDFSYGGAETTLEVALSSASRTRLLNIVENPAETFPSCGSCSITPICRGFLALHRSTGGCDLFRKIHGAVEKSAVQMQRIVARLKSEETPNG